MCISSELSKFQRFFKGHPLCLRGELVKNTPIVARQLFLAKIMEPD